MTDRPNILFIMTDQHRGDCVGADPVCPRDSEGQPLVHTPNLNSMVGEGALFSRAYSPAPSCAPARRCLWTGQTPATANATGWVTTPWDYEHYLPELLADAGYQTAHVGKLHTYPHEEKIGFQRHVDAMHATGAEAFFDGPGHEYDTWLWEESNHQYVDLSHGLDSNTWDARPTHLPEYQTDTFWRTSRALEILSDLDEDRPFFMTLSYWNPHQPFDPPQVYYEMYRNADIPAPYLGDWVEAVHDEKLPEYPKLNAHLAELPPRIVERARACYYGLVTQIDQQLTRVMRLLSQLDKLKDTFVIMTSDHGEMLGDHHLWRKGQPYEGSARVPMIIRFTSDMSYDRGQTIDQPVGLEDIMPTVLDIADIDIPDTVEGSSLLDLVRSSDYNDWRAYYHGEHASMLESENANQYLVSNRHKYIWNPVTGKELLFDLCCDPGETIDLSSDNDYIDYLQCFRKQMVDELDDRDQEFTRNGDLFDKDRPYNWPMEGHRDQYAGDLSKLY